MCRKCNRLTRFVIASSHQRSGRQANHIISHDLFSWHSDCSSATPQRQQFTVCRHLRAVHRLKKWYLRALPPTREVRSQPMKNLAMFSTQVVPCVVDDLSNFCPSIRAQPPLRPSLTSCAPRNLRIIFASAGDARCDIGGSRIATAFFGALYPSRSDDATRRADRVRHWTGAITTHHITGSHSRYSSPATLQVAAAYASLLKRQACPSRDHGLAGFTGAL
jgi:hypothetical protein